MHGYNTADEQLVAIYRAVSRAGVAEDWKSDPLQIYKDASLNFQLAKQAALDLFSVPAGEGPSESIFSMASRNQIRPLWNVGTGLVGLVPKKKTALIKLVAH